MKLGLHTYCNGKLFIKLKPENDTEREIIKFFLGETTQNKFTGIGDAINGIIIDTGKKLS